MDVEYADPELARLESDITYTGGRDLDIVRQFRRLMLLVRSVPNMNELYKYPSRHLEKLKGTRQHQHSLRLNKGWRLIIEVVKPASSNFLRIIEISNHYQ
jgi:proteic killer suppression protein